MKEHRLKVRVAESGFGCMGNSLFTAMVNQVITDYFAFACQCRGGAISVLNNAHIGPSLEVDGMKEL